MTQMALSMAPSLLENSFALPAIQPPDLQEDDHQTAVSMWPLVDSELGYFQSAHHRFWWDRGGYALAMLLHKAGYSSASQYRDLHFFAAVVAPSLGPAPHTIDGDAVSLPSFMTDNGTPIELSWDWGTANLAPKIRYSVEPIGLDIDNALVVSNRHAALTFHKQMMTVLPGVKTEWFNHFMKCFDCGDIEVSKSREDNGHASRVFYAFDLDDSTTTGKAYFFPNVKARQLGQSCLEVISKAVETAPHCSKTNLQAFWNFIEYASEPHGLAIEMLAIDMIDTSKSRIKIYLRSQQTSFRSVIDTLTLGGQIKTTAFKSAISELRDLWTSLFGINASLDQPLHSVKHRTAGILYNVEFKLNGGLPVPKVYIPVRHYGSSDEQVLEGLSKHLHCYGKHRFTKNYSEAIGSLFTHKSMREGLGIQTYIGCTIRPNSPLRIVSYINPSPRA